MYSGNEDFKLHHELLISYWRALSESLHRGFVRSQQRVRHKFQGAVESLEQPKRMIVYWRWYFELLSSATYQINNHGEWNTALIYFKWLLIAKRRQQALGFLSAIHLLFGNANGQYNAACTNHSELDWCEPDSLSTISIYTSLFLTCICVILERLRKPDIEQYLSTRNDYAGASMKTILAWR